jgi:hypothetical protein
VRTKPAHRLPLPRRGYLRGCNRHRRVRSTSPDRGGGRQDLQSSRQQGDHRPCASR